MFIIVTRRERISLGELETRDSKQWKEKQRGGQGNRVIRI